MAVELLWDGKYSDAERKIRKAPLKLNLPFQTVETINESVQERQKNLFAAASQGEWRNRLIWGDKKYVLPALLNEFAGKVNLIYIDPPFDTGANFSFQVEVEGEQFTKEPSIIEQKAYRDTGAKGLILICNGFTKPFSSCANCSTKQAVSMFISIGTLLIMQKWFWMKFLVTTTLGVRLSGREKLDVDKLIRFQLNMERKPIQYFLLLNHKTISLKIQSNR